MYTILLDSSDCNLAVGLAKDHQLIDFIQYEAWQRQSELMIVELEKILKRNNVTREEIGSVMCGIGPGSYTGVRMSATVCKMMAVFLNKPLYTVSTLKLMASGTKGIVLATIDARRGNVFGTIIDTINDNYLVKESHTAYDELKKNKYDYEVNEDNFIVDPIYCINHKEKVTEPHLLVPNYLRETEAERNLHD